MRRRPLHRLVGAEQRLVLRWLGEAVARAETEILRQQLAAREEIATLRRELRGFQRLEARIMAPGFVLSLGGSEAVH